MTHVKKKMVDGIPVLYPKGMFMGGEETDELHIALLEAFKDADGKLVLNFHGTRHLNSIAIGKLVAAHAHYARRAGRICISNVGDRMTMMLVIVNLVNVFDTYDTEDDAVASFQDWQPPEVPEEVAAMS